MNEVQLNAKRAGVTRAFGHPWIFSQGLIKRPALPPGTLLRVLSGEETLGFAFYHPGNAIALRMVHFGTTLPDNWLEERLRAALQLRLHHPLPFPRRGFRWVHGENDGLPGLTVDHYGDWLSLHVQSAGMELLLPRLQSALLALSGVNVLYERSEGAPRRQEGLASRRGFLSGSCSFPRQIEEDGLRFLVDPEDQKTGFYLDQAPNRVRLKSMVQGKRVLDLCCFSGGFSLAALTAGALQVQAVDSSAHALQRLEENRRLNALPERVLAIQSDVFEFLARPAEPFDCVILDPPPFARSVNDREAALKAYRRLNRLVAPWVAEGGRLLTFSCSGTIEEPAFAQSVFLAMRDAGRQALRLANLGPGPDHPVNLCFPEGSYLKGLDLVLRPA